MADYQGGYTGAVNDATRRDEAQSQMAMRAIQARALLQQLADQQRQQQTRQQGGGVLEALMNRLRGGGAPQMPPPPAAGNPMAPGGASIMAPPAVAPQGAIAPPPPGTQAGGPMPPGVGVSSAPAPMPQAQAPTNAVPMPPPQVPPFRALPAPPAYTESGGLAPIPAPPGEEAPAAAAAPEPKGINLKALVEGFKAAGIPKEQWMDQIEQFTPLMNAENRAELAQANMMLQVSKAAETAARNKVLELQGDERNRIARDEATSKAERRRAATKTADEANAIRREKIAKGVGGEGNITKWLYDDNDPPNIIGGLTKSGKRINLDAADVGRGTPRPAADVPARGQARDLRGYIAERNSLVAEADPKKNGARIAELDTLIKNAQAAPKPRTPAPAGAPKAMPATEGELVSGIVYQTARGPAKWNGTAFEAVAK